MSNSAESSLVHTNKRERRREGLQKASTVTGLKQQAEAEIIPARQFI